MIGKSIATTVGVVIAAGVGFLFLLKKKEQKPNPVPIIENSTLYEKLGGKMNIDTAVLIFYDKMLRDPRLKHFFRNTDMRLQIKQQQCYMCQLFGGPQKYLGKSLKEAHKGMRISDQLYESIIGLLVETFLDLGVPTEPVEELSMMLESLKSQIILQ